MAEKTAVYEGMFILDANRFARDADGWPSEIEKLIQSAGGEIEVSRLWEERRLAYPIKGHRKGAYWLTYFRLPTQKLAELTAECELHERILRQLFVRLPDSLVEHVLDHARGLNVETDGEDQADTPELASAVASSVETSVESPSSATAETPAPAAAD